MISMGVITTYKVPSMRGSDLKRVQHFPFTARSLLLRSSDLSPDFFH